MLSSAEAITIGEAWLPDKQPLPWLQNNDDEEKFYLFIFFRRRRKRKDVKRKTRIK